MAEKETTDYWYFYRSHDSISYISYISYIGEKISYNPI